MNQYSISIREYNCHVETCCHEDHPLWWIKKDEQYIQGYNSKHDAEIALERLNSTGLKIENLFIQTPTGATIVAVKGSDVSYFKEDGETDLLKFNRNCWVNTWFKQCHLTLQHFDFISVIEEPNHAN